MKKYDSLHPTNHMAKDLGRTGGAIVPRARAQREYLAQGSRGMVGLGPFRAARSLLRQSHLALAQSLALFWC